MDFSPYIDIACHPLLAGNFTLSLSHSCSSLTSNRVSPLSGVQSRSVPSSFYPRTTSTSPYMMITDDETDPDLFILSWNSLYSLVPIHPRAPFWCLGFLYPRVDRGLSRVLVPREVEDRFDDPPFVWRHFNLTLPPPSILFYFEVCLGIED